MKKSKLLLVVILVLCIAFNMAACEKKKPPPPTITAPTEPTSSTDETDKTTSNEKKIVIGLTVANMSNESNAIYADAAADYAATLDNVKLIVVDGEGSSEKQVAQCENFVSQGVDCVILSPYDIDGSVPGAKVCVDAGIPVFASKGIIADMSLVETYVGSNDLNAGIMEMEYIAEQIGGKGNIVIIEGPTDVTGAVLRNEGIHKVLEKYPDIKILYTQPADWYRDKAMSLMENWLQLGTDIDAVVAHNDEMALGAYDALVDAGKSDEVLVIGIDGIQAAFESVRDGGLNASILQDSKTIGQVSVDVAIDLALEKKIDKEYDIPYALVTIDNVNDYIS